MHTRQEENMLTGKLHSVESFGAVDGPGIRTVFFMQGCPARCLYCHNPDSWKTKNAKEEMTVEEIVRIALRGKPYYGKDGGVTFSGGEPLMQGDPLGRTERQPDSVRPGKQSSAFRIRGRAGAA